jgi:SlyX protein
VAELDDVMQQLMEVQSQMAFQEDTVQSLNEALVAQQQEILILQRQMTLLKQRQDEQATQPELDGSVPPADEKPPHY